MPRTPRIQAPGAVVHIISRFVNREFRLSDGTERDEFLDRLGTSVSRTDWQLLGYALMSSHVHLVALMGEVLGHEIMKPLEGGYAQWWNRRHDKFGPVFADRYKAIVCPQRETARLLAYVHNNPVRAGVVSEAAASDWTSHRSFFEDAPPWLAVETALELSGCASRSEFERLVDDGVNITAEEMSDAGLTAFRRRIRSELGAPVELALPTLGASRSALVVAAARPPIRVRWPGEVEHALQAVAEFCAASVDSIKSRDRHRILVEARRLALFLWRALGRSQKEMAAALGLSEAAASKLMANANEAPEIAAALAIRLFSAE